MELTIISLFQSPPLTHIEAAMNRKLGDKNAALLPLDEKLTLKEAIKTYTLDAAYQLGAEEKIGSLEAGKHADLVVFEENIFETTPKDLSDIKISMTVMNGKVVYKR